MLYFQWLNPFSKIFFLCWKKNEEKQMNLTEHERRCWIIIIGHSAWSVDISSIMLWMCEITSKIYWPSFVTSRPSSVETFQWKTFISKVHIGRFIQRQNDWMNEIGAIVFVPTLTRSNWTICLWLGGFLYYITNVNWK